MCDQGRQFQTGGGIYRGMIRYEPSCHKQVSDTQLTEIVIKTGFKQKNCLKLCSDILQYII